MKYSNEDRKDMLNEMWKEANDAFCKAMSESRSDDALFALNELKAIAEVLKYIR